MRWTRLRGKFWLVGLLVGLTIAGFAVAQEPPAEPAPEEEAADPAAGNADSSEQLRPAEATNAATQEPTDEASSQDSTAGDPAAGDPAAEQTEPAADPSVDDDAAQEASVASITSGPVAEPPPKTDYFIKVRLDPEAKTLTGEMTLIYTNLSPDLIGELRFHLYLNAFKNNRSAFMREQGGNPRTGAEHWGYQQVTSLSVNGADRSSEWRYAQPPEVPDGDQTVLVLPLNEPLLPGQPIEVSMTFEAKLPRAQARTGYHDDYFLVAQWFPKLGVWESRGTRGRDQGGWFCPPFHRNTEFYADFGNYRVVLTVPQRFVVGATGIEETPVVSEDGWKMLTFTAAKVHDFAWAASPRFLRAERMFDPATAVAADELTATMDRFEIPLAQAQLRPVRMILLYQPEHRSQADRHFEALANGLKYFGLTYGPYPYETLTMIDPAFGGRDTGGMEYPNLITIGTYFRRPAGDLSLENLILHEFAHQYWYGMVASNEVEEAWLDEGMTTYTSARLMDQLYGASPVYADALSLLPLQRLIGMRDPTRPSYHWHLRIPVENWLGIAESTMAERYALMAIEEGGVEPIVKAGYAYRDRTTYFHNAYTKPATALLMLERELGEETMARAMRAYFRRWQFDHPTTADFIAAVNEAAGRDMQWFFDALFYSEGQLDAGVTIRQERWDPAAGYMDTPDGPQLNPGEADEPKTTSVVTVTHHGSLRLPVDLEITFADGVQKRETWDGNDAWTQFRYSKKVAEVQLDPDGKLLLDTNRLNNSYRAVAEPDTSRRWSARVLGTAQHLLQFLAGGLL